MQLANDGPKKIDYNRHSVWKLHRKLRFEHGKESCIIRQKKLENHAQVQEIFFSAIIAADAVNNVDFIKSVRKAAVL